MQENRIEALELVSQMPVAESDIARRVRVALALLARPDEAFTTEAHRKERLEAIKWLQLNRGGHWIRTLEQEARQLNAQVSLLKGQLEAEKAKLADQESRFTSLTHQQQVVFEAQSQKIATLLRFQTQIFSEKLELQKLNQLERAKLEKANVFASRAIADIESKLHLSGRKVQRTSLRTQLA